MKHSKKCILPIDPNPMLHGYFHNACMFCIVSPRIKFNGVDAEIEELSFEKGKVILTDYFCKDSFKVGKNEVLMNLLIRTEGAAKKQKNIQAKGACYLYNCAKDPITCSVKVTSLRWSNTWSFAGIRIIQGDEEGVDFRIGFASNDKIAVIKNFIDHEEAELFDNNEKYCYIKVEMNEIKIYCYMSANGINWIEYLVVDNYIPSKNRKIGFYLWPDDDNFKNWFYTNYIQLHAGPELQPKYDVNLDYYTGIKMRDRYNILNPWLRQFVVNSNILHHFQDICSFLVDCIDHEHYVALMLNEKYISSSFAGNKFDFEHQNLVYGYDVDKRIFYMMGFDKHQHFAPYELTFEEVIIAYDKLTTKYEIPLLKFETSEYAYDLDISLVCKLLKEYRYNIDSSYREELNTNKKLRFYGIQIYDILLENMHKLCDQRISYIIYEHKKVMAERIKYLNYKGLIMGSNFFRLYNKSKELENLSSKLMLLCIKYIVSKKEKLMLDIENIIINIKERDIEFIDDFIQTLEEKGGLVT